MNQEITQAFIFAAGRGERMRPLTDSTPKPLLKLKGKAIIDYAIEKLLKLPKIERIIVNGFYLADQLQEHLAKFNNQKNLPKILFSHETQKVETGGGLAFAAKNDLIDVEQPLLCLNGDVAWHDFSDKKTGNLSDLELICQKWQELQRGLIANKRPEILLGLTKTADYFGYEGNKFGGGDFDLVGDELFRIENKAMNSVFVGMQIIDLRILQKAHQFNWGECFSMSNFYKIAKNASGKLERISGLELAGRYFHLGNPTNLKDAQIEF